MIKSVIVETETGFQTYSGWMIDRNDAYLVLSTVTDPAHESVPVAIPLGAIVSDVDIAA
jgi:hypothetical protein